MLRTLLEVTQIIKDGKCKYSYNLCFIIMGLIHEHALSFSRVFLPDRWHTLHNFIDYMEMRFNENLEARSRLSTAETCMSLDIQI